MTLHISVGPLQTPPLPLQWLRVPSIKTGDPEKHNAGKKCFPSRMTAKFLFKLINVFKLISLLLVTWVWDGYARRPVALQSVVGIWGAVQEEVSKTINIFYTSWLGIPNSKKLFSGTISWGKWLGRSRTHNVVIVRWRKRGTQPFVAGLANPVPCASLALCLLE